MVYDFKTTLGSNLQKTRLKKITDIEMSNAINQHNTNMIE